MSFFYRATGWGRPTSRFLYCNLLIQRQIWRTLCSRGEEWKRQILLFWWEVRDLCVKVYNWFPNGYLRMIRLCKSVSFKVPCRHGFQFLKFLHPFPVSVFLMGTHSFFDVLFFYMQPAAAAFWSGAYTDVTKKIVPPWGPILTFFLLFRHFLSVLHCPV